MSFVSQEFVMSFRPKYIDGVFGCGVRLKKMSNREVLDIGFVSGSCSEIEQQVRETLRDSANNFEQLDVEKFIKLQWWQHKDNLYFVHRSINEAEKDRVDNYLFFLEWYVQLFTIEMTNFITTLEPKDLNELDRLMSAPTIEEDKYFSELLDAKDFYFRLKRSLKAD